MKRLLAVSLVAGLAAAAASQCTIVYVNGPSFQIPGRYGARGVDINSDGATDFAFWEDGPICTMDVPTSLCIWSFNIGAAGTNELLVSTYALVQSFGSWIGSNPPSGAAWSAPGSGAPLTDLRWGTAVPVGTGGWGGSLGALGIGYIGIRFYADDGLHYGWIRIRLPSANLGPQGFPVEIVPAVVDWAYGTRPNTSIRAGAIGSDSESIQFTVEFRNLHRPPWHSGQDHSTGTFILTGNTLRGQLGLLGQFSSADIRGPAPFHAKAKPVASLGRPLVTRPDYTAFFGEVTLSHSQIIQLRRGALYVSIDHGAVLGRIVPPDEN